MSFDSLPVELLQKILDYLPPRKQLEKTFISRRWNQLKLREIYLFVCHYGQVIDRNIILHSKRGYCCFFVEFSRPYEELEPLIRICAEKFFLRKLKLNGIQSDILPLFVNSYSQWLQSVVNLSVLVNMKDATGYEEERELRQELDLSLLKSLSWAVNPKVHKHKRNMAPKYVLNTPALEDVFVEWDEDSDQPPFILKNTSSLKFLGISVPKLMLSMCPNGLPVLERLKIYNSKRPLPWNLDQFQSRVKILDLFGCRVNRETITLMRHFTNLETLAIFMESSNYINLHHIAESVPKLKQLRLFDVKLTHNGEVLNFPHLQILDLCDSILQRNLDYVNFESLEINAPCLLTLKGVADNVAGLRIVQSTVRSLILNGLYPHLSHPRQYELVTNLYLDVPCPRLSNLQSMITECILQFANISQLTVVLHNKQIPVAISGQLLATSFRLTYLHLQNFDLNYDFLFEISGIHLSTLILQEGTLDVAPDASPLNVDHCCHVFLKNVRVPNDVFSFPLRNIETKLIDAQPESNLLSTLRWNDRLIKSVEDYVTFPVR